MGLLQLRYFEREPTFGIGLRVLRLQVSRELDARLLAPLPGDRELAGDPGLDAAQLRLDPLVDVVEFVRCGLQGFAPLEGGLEVWVGQELRAGGRERRITDAAVPAAASALGGIV